MNIEPLKTLISFSNNKKMCIYEFLSSDIQSKIETCKYQEDDFLLMIIYIVLRKYIRIGGIWSNIFS